MVCVCLHAVPYLERLAVHVLDLHRQDVGDGRQLPFRLQKHSVRVHTSSVGQTRATPQALPINQPPTSSLPPRRPPHGAQRTHSLDLGLVPEAPLDAPRRHLTRGRVLPGCRWCMVYGVHMVYTCMMYVSASASASASSIDRSTPINVYTFMHQYRRSTERLHPKRPPQTHLPGSSTASWMPRRWPASAIIRPSCPPPSTPTRRPSILSACLPDCPFGCGHAWRCD